MIKKLIRLILAFYVPWIILIPSLAQADSKLVVLETSVDAKYPVQLSFNLLVESEVNITDIRLHYSIEGQSFAQVTSEVYVEFMPATKVQASWDWDMEKTGGLPPGSKVEYWWTVRDANDDNIETLPIQVTFDDSQYQWQSLTEGKLTVYWYEGEQPFIDEILQSIQQALIRLAENTGAYLEDPIKIYIYGDAVDLQSAMVFPQEWAGGVAFTRYSTIAIGIAPYDLNWGKRAITHEITHLVIHKITLNPYNDLPTWLDEGLAMYNEGELNLTLKSYLDRAIANDTLISVRSLSSPFSAYGEKARLSYAQSYSLIDFLISEYGGNKMLELLYTFHEGSDYDVALSKVYGFGMDGLDTLWRDYIAKQYQEVEVIKATMLGSMILSPKLPLFIYHIY